MNLEEFLNGPMKGRKLYHFTDTRNLSSINAHGLLSLNELTQRNIVIPAPGGNSVSHGVDRTRGLDEYVHLCFRTNHSMEFRARQDGRIQTTRWLSVDASIMKQPGVKVTLDVANKNGVDLLDPDIAVDQLDTDVLFRWLPTFNDAVRQRLSAAERCEVLIPRMIAIGLISGA